MPWMSMWRSFLPWRRGKGTASAWSDEDDQGAYREGLELGEGKFLGHVDEWARCGGVNGGGKRRPANQTAPSCASQKLRMRAGVGRPSRHARPAPCLDALLPPLSTNEGPWCSWDRLEGKPGCLETRTVRHRSLSSLLKIPRRSQGLRCVFTRLE